MVALSKKDFEQIGNYIQSNLADWLATQSLAKPTVVYEIELRERMVRVEEELKRQRELMQQGFTLMDKRFEATDKRMDRFMIWSFATTVSMGGIVIVALKIWV